MLITFVNDNDDMVRIFVSEQLQGVIHKDVIYDEDQELWAKIRDEGQCQVETTCLES